MGRIESLTAPAASLIGRARRPSTYTSSLREAACLVVTAGAWPFGFGSSSPEQLDALERRPSEWSTPVLLLHGWGANRSNWFRLERALRRAGFGRVHALNYNPFGTDIPSLAEDCIAAADELRERFGTPRVHIVGHSMGGVIARYAIGVLGAKGVGVCATIASPHNGVCLARCGAPPGLRRTFASGLQLAPDSEVMAELRRARPSSTRFVAYYSDHDVVVPAERAQILEPSMAATNVLIEGRGHLSIMFSRHLERSLVGHLIAAECGPVGYMAQQPLAA